MTRTDQDSVALLRIGSVTAVKTSGIEITVDATKMSQAFSTTATLSITSLSESMWSYTVVTESWWYVSRRST